MRAASDRGYTVLRGMAGDQVPLAKSVLART